MDINKIHFILEKEQNRKKILKEIDLILVQQNKKGLKEMNLESINLESRYDDKDTMLIKKLLQIFLPLKDRENITNINRIPKIDISIELTSLIGITIEYYNFSYGS